MLTRPQLKQSAKNTTCIALVRTKTKLLRCFLNEKLLLAYIGSVTNKFVKRNCKNPRRRGSLVCILKRYKNQSENCGN